MSTPEGTVKRRVSALLKKYNIWYSMPVTRGMGVSLLDYLGCASGRFFAIETKAEGGRLTARQRHTIEAMRRAGAIVFIITGDHLEEDLVTLEVFLAAHAVKHASEPDVYNLPRAQGDRGPRNTRPKQYLP